VSALTIEYPEDAEDVAPSERRREATASFRPGVGGWVARGVVGALVAAVVLLYPLSVPGFRAGEFTTGVIFAIIGLSLNVLIGYTGQISLGHQAFVGVGAFTSAYVVTVQGQNFAIGVLAAAAVGGLQALILGGVSLRIRGLYFALVTLAYGTLAEDSIFNIQTLTGGGAGQPAPRPTGFVSNHRFYYLCLAFLGLVLWVDWRMMRTKGGRALLALRENPRVAAAYGVNVRLFTLFAFVVSGVFAGIGGALFAHQTTFVVNVVFNFQLALVFIIMTVVGGLRSRSGVVIGSALFALLPPLIKMLRLERPLKRMDLTIPVIVLAAAAIATLVALRKRTRGAALWAPAAIAAISLLVLLPGRVPFLEARLHDVPPLTPELAPLVVGPLLLLLTLTQFPGGVGQQIRPITQWLRGRRFDIHDRGARDVVVTDVRA